MFKQTRLTALFLLSSAYATLAADFGDLAGTYKGSTDKGSAVSFSIPKKGLPRYLFRGQNVPVNAASVSGDTITMSVGTGGGRITLKSDGKGQMKMSYSFKGDRATALLAKQ